MSRRYSPRQRQHAVQLALAGLAQYGTAFACARALGPDLGVEPETLRKWIMQAQAGVPQEPTPAAELEELQLLQAEVQDLREVNEILAEATDFFAAHLDSRIPEL